MAKTKRAKSASEFVEAIKASLEDMGLPESGLERKIMDAPSILGLGDLKVVSFQRRYKAGRVDLFW